MKRRDFLSTAAVAATAGTLSMSQRAVRADDEKTLRLAVIGTGWYGMVDAKAALNAGGVEIAAICDVDSDHLSQSADELESLQGKKPATYKLYEEMLDDEELDGVIIGAPPHWHALMLLACLDRGIDVYCEKPLSYDVREGQAMVEAVEASDCVVQIGFQRRQSQAFREVKEFIAQGGIGNLVQVDAQIHYRAGLKDNTPQDPPVELDWDLWSGPGPMIPYSPQVGHKSWRLEQTSGHGHLIDWGIHLIDSCRMILDAGMPSSITAAGGLYQYKDRITTPDTLSVHFEFEPCPVFWKHRLWGATEYMPETNNGIFFYGDEGTIFATDRKWTVVRGREAVKEEHEVPVDLGGLHMVDFLEAVRTRRPTVCPVREGFRTTSTVQLAMIAYESDSIVRWDAEKQELIGASDEANSLLRREYRAPYEHPYTM
jgi:predicted dehydrogenase